MLVFDGCLVVCLFACLLVCFIAGLLVCWSAGLLVEGKGLVLLLYPGMYRGLLVVCVLVFSLVYWCGYTGTGINK